MSPSLRFLFLTVALWVGARAMLLAVVPAEADSPAERELASRLDAPEPPGPPAVPDFIEAELPLASRPAAPPMARSFSSARPIRMAGLESGPFAMRAAAPAGLVAPSPAPVAPPPSVPLLAPAATPQAEPLPARPVARPWITLDGWALWRRGGRGGALAAGGQLGASQAGVRLLVPLVGPLSAHARASAPLEGSFGGEVAAGIAWQARIGPAVGRVTVERRQSVGDGGGRNAFALIADGGASLRLPYDARLDAYAQAGVVGARSRDGFADGAVTVRRRLIGPVEGGVGLWGAAQPGLRRVDVGPSISVALGSGQRLQLDWRQRVAGNARPGSGPTLSLGASF